MYTWGHVYFDTLYLAE